MDTAKLAQWPQPKATPELGDNGRSMEGGTEAQAEWLKKRVAQSPTGNNIILITHTPNLRGAFPAETGMTDGEALVFAPGTTRVARVKIDEWQPLVK
jgi:hypothetical protein